MSKAVKLNSSQLRSLIKEAITTREPGSPLFSPPKVRLTEMPNNRMAGAPSDFSRVVTAMENALREELLGMYDPGDPSMSALGEDAWSDQVEAAMQEIMQGAVDEDRVSETLQALIDGEFHRG